MKKTVFIDMDDQSIYVKEDKNIILTISRDKMIVPAKDLYENIYKDLDLTNELEIEVNKSLTIKGKDQKNYDIFYNQLRDLLTTITSKINEEFFKVTPEKPSN